MKPKIIFIHGMFLNPKSWEPWISFFEGQGYECIAPAWPLHSGEPAALRADPPSGLGRLGLDDLHNHYRNLLSLEVEKPIVIGHSLGGLLAQKLLADDLVRAAVGLCSVAPNRMLAFDWGFMRNSASIANPFAGDEPYEMTQELFHQNFCNTLGEADSNALWEAYSVNESRQVLRDIMGHEGQIDMEMPHNPLLLIGAEKDEIIPASLVRRNAHAYQDERSHHEYKEFTGRGHFLHGEPQWEEVASSISNWLEGHLSAVRS
jgi:pimeloyl-ACP methyl ester carboxylesterase